MQITNSGDSDGWWQSVILQSKTIDAGKYTLVAGGNIWKTWYTKQTFNLVFNRLDLSFFWGDPGNIALKTFYGWNSPCPGL